MINQKIITTLVLLTLVIGGIFYLNSQKAERGTNIQGVDVVPRIPDAVILETDTENPKGTTPSNNTNQTPSQIAVNQTSSSVTFVAPEASPTSASVPTPAQAPTFSIPKSERYKLAKEITTPDGFINTDGKPITIGEFVGKKVILIDFWTYSCINCQRTTPYLNAWYDKYKDSGLVMIGIHTPEFEFEKNYDNVLNATRNMGIKFPVVLDNDFSTWTAYQNRFWPRKYLIDIDGYVVYDHIGEGAYDETEKKIQELLAERVRVLGMNNQIASGTVSPVGTPQVDYTKPLSPETYFGSSRNSLNDYSSEPSSVALNTPYLIGNWTFDPEFAENDSDEAKIIFRYQGKNVYMVASSDDGVDVEVRIDGQPVGNLAGKDVIGGELSIEDEKLYEIINDPNGWGQHTLELIIDRAGLKAFTFTFG